MIKRATALLSTLVVTGILLSPISSPSAVAQTEAKLTRLNPVTLGSKQLLRITAVNNSADQNAKVRFGRQNYTQGSCSDGVCKQVLSSSAASSFITLLPGEAASFDIPPGTAFAVRGSVFQNRQSVKVSAVIIDTMTGEIVTYIGSTGDGQSI